jgi:S-formylglutathione hydrolase FrmB
MPELGKLTFDSRRWFRRAAAALLCSSSGLGCAPADTTSLASELEPSTDTVLASVASPSAQASATLVSHTCVRPRLVEIVVSSPALARNERARVLLPPDFAAQPAASWPVLFLLHGADASNNDPIENYRLWSEKTNVEALSAQRNVIVVMPEGGNVGWYSDWLKQPASGAQNWETFHLTELRALLESEFRASGVRAIAGLSMGGFGAASYAARHPGMFEAVAAYSGLLNTTDNWAVVQSALALNGYDTSALWGDGNPLAPNNTHYTIWPQHNPTQLAARLVGVPMYVWSGNGNEDLSVDPSATGFDLIERRAHDATVDFVDAYRAAGGAPVVETGPGHHTWPFWQRALEHSFDLLTDAIDASVPSQPVVSGCFGY